MALARVMVIEDDNFSRVATVSVLSLANFEVAAADSAKSCFSQLEQFRPDVVLVDIDLGVGPTGIDVAYRLRELLPTLGLVFLTSYLDPRFSKAGGLRLPPGSRFISKGSLEDVLSLSTTILSAAHYPLNPSVSDAKSVDLSDSQIGIIRMVAAGLTNAEIAKQTSTTEKSVERSIARISEKLGIPRDPAQNPRIQLVHAFAELVGKPIPK